MVVMPVSQMEKVVSWAGTPRLCSGTWTSSPVLFGAPPWRRGHVTWEQWRSQLELVSPPP